MMRDLPHPGEFRQQLVEVAAPVRRILAAAIAEYLGLIEDSLDPATQSRCGLRCRRPDRRQYLVNGGGVDILHRHVADDRPDVLRDSVPPLLAMLGVFPCGAVRLDV